MKYLIILAVFSIASVVNIVSPYPVKDKPAEYMEVEKINLDADKMELDDKIPVEFIDFKTPVQIIAYA